MIEVKLTGRQLKTMPREFRKSMQTNA